MRAAPEGAAHNTGPRASEAVWSVHRAETQMPQNEGIIGAARLDLARSPA